MITRPINSSPPLASIGSGTSPAKTQSTACSRASESTDAAERNSGRAATSKERIVPAAVSARRLFLLVFFCLVGLLGRKSTACAAGLGLEQRHVEWFASQFGQLFLLRRGEN